MKRKALFLLALALLIMTVLFTVSCGKENTTSTDPTGETTPTPTTTAKDPATVTSASKLTSGELSLAAPVIVADDDDYAGVTRAIGDLQKDFRAVTDKSPEIKSAADSSATNIIVGTIGKSAVIDSLVDSGAIDVSTIKGQWEGFHMGVYHGFNGEKDAIVIAGADLRGTIYGIYTLSELIGVSPWYWWADVPTKEDKNLTLSVTDLSRDEKPDVQYRGIFINDEENFTFWSEKFEDAVTSPGSPNPETYKKVFELILRLKANTLWPAMHNLSDAFNKEVNPDTGIAYNAELADLYGVIMGSSHCELMLCNNETEWVPWCERNVGNYGLRKLNNDWKASYDYTVNAEAMDAYWEERVAANYKFENVYTIGLRGVHDAEILCSALSDKSYASKATVVASAIEAQLAIIEKYENLYEEEFGVRREFVTTYCPYKEAAEYYKYDLPLPEDCIILFCDDNYGYVRQLPNEEEKNSYAGFGVYYHVSYYGVPRSYLWIDTMPFSHIYEEMDKAYHAGNDDMWILNVGDLKPAEMSINFFMDLAWDEDSITADTVDDYMARYFRETFGVEKEDSEKLTEAMTEFYQLAFAYKPEYQGYNEGTEYSAIYGGDEAERVIKGVAAIKKITDGIHDSLPEEMQLAFYQVVCYKVNATLGTLEKNVYANKNKIYLAQGRFASVNAYAALSEAAHKAVLEEIQYYNSMNGGKWDGILNPYQTAQWLPVIYGAPQVTYLPLDVATDGVGAAAEGQSGTAPITLYFDSLTDDARFLDIFTLGTKGYGYTVTADSMVKLSDAAGKAYSLKSADGKVTYAGEIAVEDRLYITIDWSEVTAEDTEASLTVSDEYGHSYTYTLALHKSAVDPEAHKAAGEIGYYETNGIISMEAEHYSDSVAVNGMEWKLMEGWGYTGSAMKNFPDLSSESVRIDYDHETESPYLEYRFYVTHTGTYQGIFFRIPTLNEGNDAGVGRSNRTGWSFDNGEVQLFRGNSYVDTSGGSTWSNSVRINMEKMSFSVNITTAGWHSLRIYRVDAGTAFDKILLYNEAFIKPVTRTGLPESFNTVSYKAPLRTAPPTLSFEGLKYAESEGATLLYDLTGDANKAGKGYTPVDLSGDAVPALRYAWTEGYANLKSIQRSKDKVSARDLGFIYSDKPATFTVTLAKAGKYIVTLAIGDSFISGNTPTKNMTVSANGTTVLSGITLGGGDIIERSFVVDATDTTLNITFGGSWVVNAIEIRPYNEVEKPEGKPFEADDKGDVIIEPEWALENTDNAYNTVSTDGKNAYFMETGGLYGSAVYFGPNRTGSYGSTDAVGSQSAKLHFKVNAPDGKYNLFMLVKSQDDDDDSVIIAWNNSQVQTANDFKDTQGGFVWKKIGTVTVSDGEGTLTVLGREDGLVIDRIVLTTKASWS